MQNPEQLCTLKDIIILIFVKGYLAKEEKIKAA